MESLQINTSHNVTIDYPLASLGDRMVATLLDMLVQYSYVFMMFMLIGIFSDSISITIQVIMILPFVFYPLLCELFLNGQSVGKRALSLKVIRLDGNNPTLSGYFLRWMFGLLEVTTLSVVAILSIIIRGKGQRLGDVAAGTCVVKLKKYVRLQPSNLHRAGVNYQVTFPQVTQLSDRDINIVKEVIFTYRRNRNIQPLETTTLKVKSMIGVSSDLPLAKFLETIVRDYNFITSDMLVK
jgi:uncharacterized RDD family membrane protein YckC